MTMPLQSTTASGSGSRPCSSVRPTARSGSDAPPCRRRRTRAFRSSFAASCTWRSGCGSSGSRALSPMPIRRCSRSTSRWREITCAPTAMRWSRRAARRSVSRTPTPRSCIGGRSTPGRAYGLAADSRTLADAWEQLGEALRSMGEPDAAAQALTEARRLLGNDPIAQARICHSHAKVAERSASLTAAVRWLQRGLRWADGVGGCRCGGLPGADPVLPRRDPQPAGSLGGGDLDVPPGDRRGRGGRRAQCAGARVLCARLGAGRVRPARAGHSLLAGARALRAARRSSSTSRPF